MPRGKSIRSSAMRRACPEWLSTRCRVLELMLKQGRVEEADELAALILRESARARFDARARAGWHSSAWRFPRRIHRGCAALARESWQMFVDGCDDPVPEFLKIIQSQKEGKKTPVDLGEANDSLTRLSWVRSPTLAELPGLALEYGRGLLEVAAATSRLYSETGPGWAQVDALVMLEQAELVFKLVSSEFGVDVTLRSWHVSRGRSRAGRATWQRPRPSRRRGKALAKMLPTVTTPRHRTTPRPNSRRA